MIFNQGFYYYFFAFVIFTLLVLRLRVFFSYYFPSNYSQLIISSILFHPLSIDAFLLPNVFTGALSFLFFVEAIILFKKEREANALTLLLLASVLNVTYCLLPIYFFYHHYKKVNKLLPYAIGYTSLLVIFIVGNFLNGSHNPLIFFSYFLQNLIAPYPVNLVNWGLFPFSKFAFFITLLCISLFYFMQRKKAEIKIYFSLLFLPIIGSILIPWNYGYQLWSNIFMLPSSYMVITFSFIFFLAHYMPRKIFNFYFLTTFILSLFWTIHFFPFSGAVSATLSNLPTDFAHNTTSLKRLLVRQYYAENKFDEAQELGLLLYTQHPKDIEILNDLIELKFIPAGDLSKGPNTVE